MGSRAFWAFVFGFIGGVFVRSFLLIGWSFAFLFLLLGIVSFLAPLLGLAKKRVFILAGIACVACALGIARMQTAILVGDQNLTENAGKNILVQGTIAQEPDARDTSTLIAVKARSFRVGGQTMRANATVLASLPAHARVAYGDVIQVKGILTLPKPFATGTAGRVFDYPEYLAAQGIAYRLERARVDSITGNDAEVLKAFAIGEKETFLRGLGAVMPDPESALAGGITVGDKHSIGPELTNDFARDSLVHMVVLSGYNITVVLNAIAKLLSWTPRFAQFGGSAFAVAFFVLMAGGASSAVRAGLMALIAVFARATHRVYLGERALAFTTVAMVAWNPWTLCFDPSFQLSALATFGLILFTPMFSRWFERVPETLGAREILSSTCATQLMVLPLLLYQNGTLSLVALPANLLALLPVPWAMFFSFVAGLGGALFGPAAAILAFPTYALLWYIIVVAHALAGVPFAAIEIPPFQPAWLFVAYGTLLLLWWFEKRSADA